MAIRALDCPGGLTLTGVDDDDLVLTDRTHADEHHPTDGITDAFIRDHVRANGRAVDEVLEG